MMVAAAGPKEDSCCKDERLGDGQPCWYCGYSDGKRTAEQCEPGEDEPLVAEFAVWDFED